jgi:hypothetical protein
MVELHILAADAHEGDEWQPIAYLRVRSDEIEIDDPLHVLDLNMPVVSLRTHGQVRFEDDREEWARSLSTAYRTGDIIVRILHDDDPLREDEFPAPDVVRQEVHLRERLGERT